MVSQLRFSRITKEFYTTLSDQDKLAFIKAASILAEDPFSVEGVNLGLGFPYRPDICGVEIGDFWLAYFVNSDGTLWIANARMRTR